MRDAMKLAVETQVNPELKIRVQKLSDKFESVVNDELNPILNALDNDDMATALQIYKDKYAKSYGVMRKEANALLETLLEQAETQNQGKYRQLRQRPKHTDYYYQCRINHLLYYFIVYRD